MFIGFAGKAFTEEGQLKLKPKELVTYNEYQIELESVNQEIVKDEESGAVRYGTQVALINVYKDNQLIGQDTTEIRNYLMYSLSEGAYSDSQQTSEPAVIAAGFHDLYFQLGNPEESGYRIQFWYNPLIRWVWIGFGFVVILASFLYFLSWKADLCAIVARNTISTHHPRKSNQVIAQKKRARKIRAL